MSPTKTIHLNTKKLNPSPTHGTLSIERSNKVNITEINRLIIIAKIAITMQTTVAHIPDKYAG